MLQRLLLLLFLAIELVVSTAMTPRRQNGDYMDEEDATKLKAASLATIQSNTEQAVVLGASSATRIEASPY